MTNQLNIKEYDSNSENYLQTLVDDHARLGMNNAQIREHLYDSGQHNPGHGIPKTQTIPPPTKAARKARENLFKTGPRSFEPKQKDLIAKPKLIISQEIAQSQLNDFCANHGIPGVTVKYNELRQDRWSDSTSAYLSTIYRATGQTLLDRIIHGCAGIFKELKFGPGSNYEIFKECISNRSAYFKDSKTSKDLIEEWNIAKAIDTYLYPWFNGSETTNIQIDAEMAQIFLAGKPPSSSVWMQQFIEKPIYIDIKEKTYGQRTLSGIFCHPIPSLGTFTYMATIEWVGQGYEAFIFGDYGNPKEALIMLASDDDEDESRLTQQIIDSIYDPLVEQIEKIVAMASMYYQTQLDAKNPITSLNRFQHTGNKAISDLEKNKKERNKEKTHSYFHIMRLETPANRFGFVGPLCKSWSLDHLISVAGHFRWQPYGSGNSLLKLIWIDNYEKGQGERHRPENNPTLFKI